MRTGSLAGRLDLDLLANFKHDLLEEIGELLDDRNRLTRGQAHSVHRSCRVVSVNSRERIVSYTFLIVGFVSASYLVLHNRAGVPPHWFCEFSDRPGKAGEENTEKLVKHRSKSNLHTDTEAMRKENR
jgi:hypothetical protein